MLCDDFLVFTTIEYGGKYISYDSIFDKLKAELDSKKRRFHSTTGGDSHDEQYKQKRLYKSWNLGVSVAAAYVIIYLIVIKLCDLPKKNRCQRNIYGFA